MATLPPSPRFPLLAPLAPSARLLHQAVEGAFLAALCGDGLESRGLRIVLDDIGIILVNQ
jgi:hypothetical protein